MRTGCSGNGAIGLGLRAAVLATAAHIATYGLWRDRCLGWGATPQERNLTLPGDELLAQPDLVSTRATTVDAPAEYVWPWLVQMGPGRGGAYTYDWIENLFGLGMHSANEVLPQYQDLKVGDTFQLGPHGPVLRVAILDPQRALVMRSDDGNWVWAFCLLAEASTTRLVSRNRIAAPGASKLVQALNRYVMEPGSLIMERKMLIGIKERAERLASVREPAAARQRTEER